MGSLNNRLSTTHHRLESEIMCQYNTVTKNCNSNQLTTESKKANLENVRLGSTKEDEKELDSL
jgi:hypothetical protein